VVCGSAATERDYLNGLRRHARNPAITVKIKNKPVSPAQLVAYTAELWKQSREDFDAAWCVFDVDEFQDVRRAVVEARRARIEVAVSNPCFELWLLLHFCPHTRQTGTYRELLPYLRKHLPDYDKARLDFRCFEGTWRDAVERARPMAPSAREHEVNPATGVWPLVQLIAER
jgi:hypothetical protein